VGFAQRLEIHSPAHGQFCIRLFLVISGGVFGEASIPDSLLTLVISVSASDRRRASAAAQLNAIGWRFRFVEGHTADSDDIRRLYSEPLNRRYARRPLTQGEIAVYASHRRALREFLDGDARLAMILEDDFCIVDPVRMPQRIAAILSARLRWDVIKLFDFAPRRIVQQQPADDVAIVNYASPTAGMVAYLVTRRGAELILARPSLFRPIDEDTKYYWELAIRVYSVFPNLVSEISGELGGSLIAAEREALRQQRGVGGSLKGWWVTASRRLQHRWHRSRYAMERF
jgi:GR25 family glycosyltransferase involved in LPS biosynthesis